MVADRHDGGVSEVRIRPMTTDDVPAAEEITADAFLDVDHR